MCNKRDHSVASLPAIYSSLEVLRAEKREKVSKKSSRAFRRGVSKKSRKGRKVPKMGPFGPRAPSVQKVSPECRKGVPDTPGTLSEHSRDTFWTLRSPGPKGPRDTPWDTPGDTPVFGALSGTLPETLRARRARETPVAGRGGSQVKTAKMPKSALGRVRKVFSGLRSESPKTVSRTVQLCALGCFARCEVFARCERPFGDSRSGGPKTPLALSLKHFWAFWLF